MLKQLNTQSATQQDINRVLKELFSRCMNIPTTELDDEESFFSLGLSSLIHAEVIEALTTPFPDLPSTVLFEYPNFKMLSAFLEKKHPDLERIDQVIAKGDI
jgi:acyl carrier protein